MQAENATSGTLTGQVAVVTGAARGIGRHAARTLAAAGARVCLADLDTARLEQTAAELRGEGATALTVQTDVRDDTSVQQLMQRAISDLGGLDILVNNAGIVPHFRWGVQRWPAIRDMDESAWERVIDTNLGGTFRCTKYALRHMTRERKGHVVSLHGGGSGTGACAYVVTKDAIRTFTRYVAEEVRGDGVCVVIVAPGAAIATEDAPEAARASLPGPESLADLFVLAAQAPMGQSGKLLVMGEGGLRIENA